VFRKPYTYAPLRAEDKAPMRARENIAGPTLDGGFSFLSC
jgi:hypothetical protein